MDPFTPHIPHAMKYIVLHFGGRLEYSIYHINAFLKHASLHSTMKGEAHHPIWR